MSLILLLSLAHGGNGHKSDKHPAKVVPAPIEWACEGNSYMMLKKGWKPKPPQCHKVPKD